MSRIEHRLCLAGLALFLLALLQGFAIPGLRARRRRARRTRGGARIRHVSDRGGPAVAEAVVREAGAGVGGDARDFAVCDCGRPDAVGDLSGRRRSRCIAWPSGSHRGADDERLDRAARVARRGDAGV